MLQSQRDTGRTFLDVSPIGSSQTFEWPRCLAEPRQDKSTSHGVGDDVTMTLCLASVRWACKYYHGIAIDQEI